MFLLSAPNLKEQIIASDNRLSSLPQKLIRLIVISHIDVRNNRLGTIPTELSRMPTLAELLCDGNPQLASAPENMRGDSKLLLVCLEMQQKFKDVMVPKDAQRAELQAQSNKYIHELSQARSRIEQLEREIAFLEWERPSRYIYWKRRMVAFICYLLEKTVQWFDWAWQAFQRWRNRRKTAPLY
mmetsp:Transcript_18223/g.38234  ORF Transcript_18223/g.38234 Transcript_18223/m.38234 type:complete len:184 (-) Transcript_18223:1648-2199(-)